MSEVNGHPKPEEPAGETRLVGPAERAWIDANQEWSRNSLVQAPGAPPGPSQMQVLVTGLMIVIQALDRIEIHAARRAGELQISKDPPGQAT